MPNLTFKLILGGMVFTACFLLAVFLSHYTENTDFAVFYYAAKTILDPNIPNYFIYHIDTANIYSLPEARGNFVYSIPAAYIMSPLALLPYYKAKAAMIFINILMYLAAVAIILHMGGASGRWFFYPLALSFLWPPFIQNLRLAQVNAILFFLITVSVLFAQKTRPILCGTVLAIATTFKLFPVAVAMVLGIKNWRIFLTSILVFCAFLFIPNSVKWFQALKHIYLSYNPLYLWLKPFGIGLFWIFAVTVAGLTALIVFQSDDTNYPLFTSFAIPAIFLTMPIFEYHHLTLLILSYTYLIVSLKWSNRLIPISIFISMILISISPFLFSDMLFSKAIVVLGLFIIWLALALKRPNIQC
jgi:hypothetical protein